MHYHWCRDQSVYDLQQNGTQYSGMEVCSLWQSQNRVITCPCFPMLAGFLIWLSSAERGKEGHSNSFEEACFHLEPGLICCFLWPQCVLVSTKNTTECPIIYILYKVPCISFKIVGSLQILSPVNRPVVTPVIPVLLWWGGRLSFPYFPLGFKYPVSTVRVLLWFSYQRQFGVKHYLNKI